MIALILFLLSISTLPGVHLDDLPPLTGFKASQTISLIAEARIYKDAKNRASYRLTEAYSGLLGSSKIRYQALSGLDVDRQVPEWQYNESGQRLPGEASFYTITKGANTDKFDKPRVFLITSSTLDEQLSCEQSKPEVVEGFLMHNLVKEFDQPDHVIGSARVFYLIDKYRDKFKRIIVQEDIELDDDKAIGYSLDEGDFKMNLFYSKRTLERGFSGGYSSGASRLIIPMMVNIYVPDADALIYTFKRVQLHPTGQSESEKYLTSSLLGLGKLDTSQAENDILYDEFVLPPEAGCSSKSNSSDLALKEFPFNMIESMIKDYRFSLSGRIISMQQRGEPMEFYGAYESQLGVLRWDKIDKGRHAIGLINYRLNRFYHVLLARGDPNQDKVMRTIVKQPDGGGTGASKFNKPLRSCVATSAVNRTNGMASAPMLWQMLLGKDKFLYLGRALVRGLEANVFEATEARWPLLLRQPMTYNKTMADGSSQMRMMKPEWGARDDDDGGGQTSTLKVIAYVGVDGQRLLMLEVYTLRLDKNLPSQMSDKFTLWVHDFRWQLELASPDGERAADTFSLSEHCSEDLINDSTRMAKVEMLLASESQTGGPKWLQSTAKRNLALLQAIQTHLNVASPMVHNLESRLHQRDSSSSQNKLIGLPVSFEYVTKREENFVQLHLLGRGTLKRVQGQYARLTKAVAAFQVCALLAMHRWSRSSLRLQFGFAPESELCILVSANEWPMEEGSAFDFSTKDSESPSAGSLLVFEVVLAEGASSSKLMQLPDEAGLESLKHLRQATRLPVVYSEPVDAGQGRVTSSREWLDFLIRSIDVIEADDATGSSMSTGSLQSGNKFVGLAWSLDDADFNWRWSEPSLSVWRKSASFVAELTLEQCQSACLGQVNCQSFSYCIRGAQIECILSRLSARKDLAKQLEALLSSGPRLGSHQINFVSNSSNQTNVTVFRQAHCEIHEKNYLDLYSKAQLVQQTIGGNHRRVIQTETREDCARLCFEQTLEALSQDQRATSDGAAVENSPNFSSSSSSLNWQAIKEATLEHRRALAQVCGQFYFIDAMRAQALSGKPRTELESRLERPLSQLNNGGLCLLETASANDVNATGHDEKKNINQGEQELVYLSLERHPFSFLHLFQRHSGIRLRASSKSPEERDAYARLAGTAFQTDSSRAFELMQAFSERLGNTQLLIYADYNQCAQACFKQTNFMWPACRSFDVELKVYADVSYVMCSLNTLTLRQVLEHERFDLLLDDEELDAGAKARIWHFEPLPGPWEAEVMHSGQVENRASSLEAREFLQNLRAGSLGLVCLVLISLCLGLLAGHGLGSRLFGSDSNPEWAAQEQLVLTEARIDDDDEDDSQDEDEEEGNATGGAGHRKSIGEHRAVNRNHQVVEFKNLVNFEGRMQ